MKIMINGAKGKMGSVTVNAVQQQNNFELVGTPDHANDLATEIKNQKPDIVIDFTSAEYAYENTLTIIESGARPVIGTSGLTKEQVKSLQTLSKAKKLGGIIAPNFSIGAILMMRFAEQAAHYFKHAEIIEFHHEKKKDAPSGTAMKTAAMIEAVRENATVICEESLPGALGAKCHSVPVHSVRLPGLLAHQEVIFGDLGETLTLRHDSIDRQGFMPGVIMACKKVMELDCLVYGLETLLSNH